jgi:TolA-binding protein
MMHFQPNERPTELSEGERQPRELERELADLRKEVLEARNLVIKTDNLLKNIHAEVKLVAKKGEDYYRRTWFSSAVAYLIFFGFSIAVAILAARASVSSEKAEKERVQAEASLAKKKVEELSAKISKSRQEAELARGATEQAFAAYLMLTAGSDENRLKGVDAIAKLDRSRLNALNQKALDDRAGSLKAELAKSAYQRGNIAYNRHDMKNVLVEFRRYLTLNPQGSEAISAAYMAGVAAHQMQEWKTSIPFLERYLSVPKLQKNGGYAHFLLGQSYEQVGDFAQAMATYEKGIADYSASRYTGPMRQKLRALKSAKESTEGSSPASTPVTIPKE